MDPVTMMMMSMLGNGASSVLGNLINGFFGQKAAETQANAETQAGNEAAQVQRETNAMTVELANTAHQREVKDLQAAGLNPLLSGTGGQGAVTPTLQAPVQAAQGKAKAGEAQASYIAQQGQNWGNAIMQMPSQVMQLMNGFQQIELQRANTDKALAEAKNLQTQTNWIDQTNAQNISESQSRVVEQNSRSRLNDAQTATADAMRAPEVERVVAQAAQAAQQTKTEEQRTIEQKAAAANAQKLYGAKASEAATLAAQAADYYKNFFAGQEANKLNTADLQIELLKNENFQKVIQNTLDNDYGRLQRLSTLDWTKLLGPAVSKDAGVNPNYKVTK